MFRSLAPNPKFTAADSEQPQLAVSNVISTTAKARSSAQPFVLNWQPPSAPVALASFDASDATSWTVKPVSDDGAIATTHGWSSDPLDEADLAAIDVRTVQFASNVPDATLWTTDARAQRTLIAWAANGGTLAPVNIAGRSPLVVTSPTPEPAGLVLLGAAGGSLLFRRRHSR
jgi:hypothetical protein